MKALHVISFILVIIGGLNWGLVGLGGFMGSNWNVVNMIVGSMPAIEWLVYVLVGYLIFAMALEFTLRLLLFVKRKIHENNYAEKHTTQQKRIKVSAT